MASHASALKAHRQSLKNREHNRQFRSRLRSALKNVRAAIAGNDLNAARTVLKQTVSLIDKMASKGIIHRNAAGRYKSRLSSRLAARSYSKALTLKLHQCRAHVLGDKLFDARFNMLATSRARVRRLLELQGSA